MKISFKLATYEFYKILKLLISYDITIYSDFFPI